MNRKQRKFGELGRLMRSHRRPMRGWARGLRFDSDGPGGGGGGAGGGGGNGPAVLDLPKVDIPLKFSMDNPEKDVPNALETIRASMIELEKRGKLTGDAFKKVCSDIEEVRSMAKEGREAARAALRDVPAPDDSDKPFRSLKHLSLGLRVAGEADKEFGPAFQALARKGDEGRGQYNLLVRTEADLGLEKDSREARALRRLKVLHNATVLMNIAHGRDPQYLSAGGYRALPWFDEVQKLGKMFVGALSDATATEGKEWVQVNLLASTIYERIELELEFSRVFGTFPMLAKSVKWPVFMEHGEGFRVLENVADAGDTTDATITADSWETNDATFDAEKYAAAVVLSSEWEEDAIENSQRAEERLARRLARIRENAIINGQATSAIDGGTIAASNIRKLWDGIRWAFAQTGKTARDMATGITADELAAMFGAQGPSGAKPRESAFLSGVAGFARLLVLKGPDNSPVVLTMAQLGPNATFLTGALGICFGRGVYVSEFVSEKMQPDGTIDDIAAPTGTKTAIYHIHHDPMKIGQRRGILASRSDHFRFLQDQVVFKATAREDFQFLNAPSATKVLVMAGFNVATF